MAGLRSGFDPSVCSRAQLPGHPQPSPRLGPQCTASLCFGGPRAGPMGMSWGQTEEPQPGGCGPLRSLKLCSGAVSPQGTGLGRDAARLSVTEALCGAPGLRDLRSRLLISAWWGWLCGLECACARGPRPTAETRDPLPGAEGSESWDGVDPPPSACVVRGARPCSGHAGPRGSDAGVFTGRQPPGAGGPCGQCHVLGSAGERGPARPLR